MYDMFVFWRIYLKHRSPHFMSQFFLGIYVGGPKMDLKDPRGPGISGCAMYMSPKPTKKGHTAKLVERPSPWQQCQKGGGWRLY